LNQPAAAGRHRLPGDHHPLGGSAGEVGPNPAPNAGTGRPGARSQPSRCDGPAGVAGAGEAARRRTVLAALPRTGQPR
jgi:hypothetical protein